MSQQTQDVPF